MRRVILSSPSFFSFFHILIRNFCFSVCWAMFIFWFSRDTGDTLPKAAFVLLFFEYCVRALRLHLFYVTILEIATIDPLWYIPHATSLLLLVFFFNYLIYNILSISESFWGIYHVACAMLNYSSTLYLHSLLCSFYHYCYILIIYSFRIPSMYSILYIVISCPHL